MLPGFQWEVYFFLDQIKRKGLNSKLLKPWYFTYPSAESAYGEQEYKMSSWNLGYVICSGLSNGMCFLNIFRRNFAVSWFQKNISETFVKLKYQRRQIVMDEESFKWKMTISRLYATILMEFDAPMCILKLKLWKLVRNTFWDFSFPSLLLNMHYAGGIGLVQRLEITK